MVFSMNRKGNCWDNAPTECFSNSLKRKWLTGSVYPAREAAAADYGHTAVTTTQAICIRYWTT